MGFGDVIHGSSGVSRVKKVKKNGLVKLRFIKSDNKFLHKFLMCMALGNSCLLRGGREGVASPIDTQGGRSK